MPPRSVSHPLTHHVVTAVLVTHDGARWLPTTLTCLRDQRRPPDRMVGLDTGSTDDSRALLEQALGADAVLERPRTTSYAAAINDAVEAVLSAATTTEGAGSEREEVEWIWLLHDDCAPQPDALHALLTEADASPSAVVLGPKCLTWNGRFLAEIGITTDVAARRETGLDRHEVDQGQHDNVRQTLAVGSAGCLIRRDVWTRLGGFDPALPPGREDLDFGWRATRAGGRVVVVPSAVVRHAAAGSRGLRTTDYAGGSRRRTERQAGLAVLLANSSRPALAMLLPRIMLATLVRALGWFVVRRPRDAIDEIMATLTVIGHPERLRHARADRRRTATVPPAAARALLAGPGARLRSYVEALGEVLPGRPSERPLPARRTVVETGPATDDVEELPTGPSVVRAALSRPWVVLVLILCAVSLIAERHLLTGALTGGRLLAAPAGASDLWSQFTAGWHRVGMGSSAAAPPYLGLLAGLSTVLFGKPWLAEDVLLLGCVPLGGLAAYAATRGLTRSWAVRVWAGLTWGLLPVATGAVAGGRLDAAVATIALPLVFRAGCRVIGGGGRPGLSGATGTALGLALTCAFAPLLYPVAVACLTGGLVVTAHRASGRRGEQLMGAAVIVVLPFVLLWPWSVRVSTHPAVVLGGIGAPGPALGRPSGQSLLALGPGGAGTPPHWLFIPLVVAALAACARSQRRRLILTGWGFVAVGYAAAVLVTRVDVRLPGGSHAGPAWPGVATAVIAVGLLLAAVAAADGAAAGLARHDFSWRQPFAAGIAVLCLLMPIAAGVAWIVRGAQGPVSGQLAPAGSPAFLATDLGGADRPRLLVLGRPSGEPRSRTAVGFAVWPGGEPPTVGAADVAPGGRGTAALTSGVRRLLSGTGQDVVTPLRTLGIRDIEVLDAPPRVERVLAHTAGLVRVGPPHDRVWRVTPPAAQLLLLSNGATRTARAGRLPTAAELSAGQRVPVRGLHARGNVSVASGPRLLVLAQAASSGWHASIAGHPLQRVTAYGWAQGFLVPAGSGGALVLGYHTHRGWQVGLEVVLFALAILACVPNRRRTDRPQGPPADTEAPPLVAAVSGVPA